MKSCSNNTHTASEGAQDKKIRVRVLGRTTCLKSKLQSLPQAYRHRKPTNAVVKRLGRQMGAAHKKLPGSSYRKMESFVTDRKRAGACLRSPAVSP